MKLRSKNKARRLWKTTAICCGTAAIFLVLLFTQFHFQPLDRLETYAQDMQMVLGAKTPVDTNLVLIGVDRTEYSSLFDDDEIKAEPVLASMQKSFPWPRSVWARLIEKLGDAGAKVIMLDFMFGSRGVDDDQLRAALDKYGQKTVIACNIHDLSSDRGDTLTIDWPNTSVLNYIPTNGGKFDDRFGYINIWPDEDGVVRSARYKLTGGKSADFIKEGSVLESFDAVALRKFGHPEAVPHDDEPVRFRYTRWAGQGYPAISVADVLGPKTWKSNFGNGAFFKDKIVLIGPTADIFQDYHKTPFPEKFGVVNGASYHYSSMMPGPEIHLNMIGAALHNTFIRQSPVETDICIIMLASLMASVLSYKIIQPVRRMLALVVLGAAYLHVTHLLYNHFNVLVQIASPLLVWFLSGILVLAYDYFVELFERTRVRRTLERYVSRNIVKELLENPDAHIHNEEGARMPVTVLFSDLRGFTTMTENADSAQLVRQLNEYFTEMVRVVFKYEGTLDKFIGDAVMAVWGNMLSEGPAQDARNARNAVSAALAMKQSLARLNADWQSRGIPPLAFGIGINHGEAISGNMGSHEKMEFTVIGDAVNTASRLEGLTKKFHLDLLIGETMAPLVKDHFLLRTVGLIQPKGKTIPATLYAVMGERGADVDAALEEWVKAYETAVAKYRARDFDGASGHFRECLKARPGDYLCEMYLAECEAFLKNPPAIDWNGVIVMTEK